MFLRFFHLLEIPWALSPEHFILELSVRTSKWVAKEWVRSLEGSIQQEIGIFLTIFFSVFPWEFFALFNNNLSISDVTIYVDGCQRQQKEKKMIEFFVCRRLECSFGIYHFCVLLYIVTMEMVCGYDKVCTMEWTRTKRQQKSKRMLWYQILYTQKYFTFFHEFFYWNCFVLRKL